jgi:hypothetical protein
VRRTLAPRALPDTQMQRVRRSASRHCATCTREEVQERALRRLGGCEGAWAEVETSRWRRGVGVSCLPCVLVFGVWPRGRRCWHAPRTCPQGSEGAHEWNIEPSEGGGPRTRDSEQGQRDSVGGCRCRWRSPTAHRVPMPAQNHGGAATGPHVRPACVCTTRMAAGHRRERRPSRG